MLCVALLCGCRSSTLAELQVLAESPPLHYSTLLTGGAFVAGPEPATPLSRTYPDAGHLDEAFPLAALREVLELGRVFERVALDERDANARRAVAAISDSVTLGAAQHAGFLAAARGDGNDFLLVVERVEDGEVQRQGINGQWPITAAVWLLIGLGMVIPDHTYESRATLRVSVRELQTGSVVHQMVFDAGPVDLSLLERTDFWGLLTSIVVPPFWVGDDFGNVVTTVRSTTTPRLLTKLARELKTIAVRQRLAGSMVANIELELVDGGRLVRVASSEGLSFVRMSIDGRAIGGAAFDDFEAALLAGVQRDAEDRYVYVAVFPGPLRGRLLRVVVQTVSGSVASTTIGLGGS